MKILKIILFSITLATIGVSISACGGETSKTEQQGKEYTSAYTCPMHCEGSGSDAAGNCPVCGMEYVKNENHKPENHEGHSH